MTFPPRRSSPDRVHVSPLTCHSSFNCCSLRIRLELHRQENPCQLFFQHQIGTLTTFPHWTPITSCHLNHLYFFKIEKVPGGRERKTRCSKQLFCTLFCLSSIHDVWRHTLAVQNGQSPPVQYKILPCLALTAMLSHTDSGEVNKAVECFTGPACSSDGWANPKRFSVWRQFVLVRLRRHFHTHLWAHKFVLQKKRVCALSLGGNWKIKPVIYLFYTLATDTQMQTHICPLSFFSSSVVFLFWQISVSEHWSINLCSLFYSVQWNILKLLFTLSHGNCFPAISSWKLET